jgi:hypothetical protein
MDDHIHPSKTCLRLIATASHITSAAEVATSAEQRTRIRSWQTSKLYAARAICPEYHRVAFGCGIGGAAFTPEGERKCRKCDGRSRAKKTREALGAQNVAYNSE